MNLTRHFRARGARRRTLRAMLFALACLIAVAGSNFKFSGGRAGAAVRQQGTKLPSPMRKAPLVETEQTAKPGQGRVKTLTLEPASTSCPTKTPISPGQTLNGALAGTDCGIGDGSFYDEYTFSAAAGQQVSISMSSTDFDTYLFLLKPSETFPTQATIQDDDGGSGGIGPGNTNSRIPATSGMIALPETGTYSILANSFDANQTGNYSVTLTFGGTGGTICPPNPTPITNGQTLNGTLATGDCTLPDGSFYDAFSFSATAGQQVTITMAGTAPLDAYLILLAPDTSDLAEDDNGGGGTNARIPATGGFAALPQTGTYTIIANSALSGQSGNYSVSLSVSATNCPTTPINIGQTVDGSLANTDCRLPADGSFLDAYTFNGTAGQRVAITMTSTAPGFDSFLFLLSPTGAELSSDDNSAGGTNARIPGPTGFFALPSTGTYTILANSAAANQTGNYTLALTETTSVATLQFSASSYSAGEGVGSVQVFVSRIGSASSAATVSYATSDSSGSKSCSTLNTGVANSRCDYETTVGMLRFAAGETSKTILIPIVDDSYAEGSESFTVTLSNATGDSLGSPSVATVNITDNETTTGANPIDQANFFVRLHYVDFLNREPDASGLAFWTNQITECQQPGATCNAEVRRINVSAAFFLSIEFQETGYLVERLYKSAYGDAIGTSNFGPTHQLAVPVIRFNEFLPDTQQIGQGVVVGQTGWETVLENNKQTFTAEFVVRARFTTAFPTTLTPAQFVDMLFANAGVVPSTTDRNAAIAEFGAATNTANTAARARALRRVAENTTLNQQEFNRAFVLMQYYGYLRRNPNETPDSDYSGYDFWLTKLNQFNGNFINAEMVKAFIISGEYRQRFGP